MYFIRDNFQVFSATSADGLTWIEDSSFRISTETAPSLDASSVTSCAVLPLADGSYRMLYTAKSSSASYHILSAASTDGLNWIKDPGVRYETGTSSVTLDSLRVTALSSGRWRLYYLERSSSTGVLDIFDLKTATAPNNALAWTAHRVIASSLTAGGIDVSTMTDGSIRLFYSLPSAATDTVHSRLYSAVSANGTTFSAEAHIWLSTDTASGGIGAFAIRRTQGFRYRAYYGFIQTSSFIPGIYSALTTTPDLQAVSPGIGMNNDAGFTLTMTGEIISTGTLTAVLTKADQTNITATSILRNSDLSATAVFNLLGADLGQWNVILTNHDAQSSTLTDALNIDFPAGDVDITDNLFNPRRGQQARIDVDIHHPGDLSLSIYTINGEPVARIFNQPASIGRTSVLWPGTTESGNVVASGLYYLRTKGPKLDQIDKIIVVK